MDKVIKYICWVIAAINSICSIVLICVICPRSELYKSLEFDYVGVIIAILSLLITILIGWNIYALVDVRGIEKKGVELEDKLNKYINGISDDLKIKFSNNVVTAIDLLLETSEFPKDYEKRLSTHFAFYFVAKGNGSESVRVALYRIISNEILIVINMGENASNEIIEKLAKETSYRYVSIYLSDLVGHDDVRLWLNKLVAKINKNSY